MPDPNAWNDNEKKADPRRRRLLWLLTAGGGSLLTRLSVVGGVLALLKELWSWRPTPAPVPVPVVASMTISWESTAASTAVWLRAQRAPLI